MGTSSTLIHRENQSSPTDRLVVVVISSRREKKNESNIYNRSIYYRPGVEDSGRANYLSDPRARAGGRRGVRAGLRRPPPPARRQRDKKRNVRRRRRVLRRAGVGETTRAWRRRRGTRGERGAGEEKRGTGREGKGREARLVAGEVANSERRRGERGGEGGGRFLPLELLRPHESQTPDQTTSRRCRAGLWAEWATSIRIYFYF